MKDAFGTELVLGSQVVTHLRATVGDSRRLVKAVVAESAPTPTGMLRLRFLDKKDRGYRSSDKLLRLEEEVMYTGVHHSTPIE